jgi:hypothetical protein
VNPRSGAPGPPCPATAPDGKPIALFTLYLIAEQSGWAKAKPLSIHNKTLIWLTLLGGHSRRCRRRMRGRQPAHIRCPADIRPHAPGQVEPVCGLSNAHLHPGDRRMFGAESSDSEVRELSRQVLMPTPGSKGYWQVYDSNAVF